MDRQDVEKALRLAGIGDDPEKYMEQLEKVERLFSQLDRWLDEAPDEPLYHPLDIDTEPRKDEPITSDARDWIEGDEEGYVEAPPLRRR